MTGPGDGRDAAPLIDALCRGAVALYDHVSRARIADLVQATDAARLNDRQIAADAVAERLFEQCGLPGVRRIVSEERPAPRVLDPDGAFDLFIDPLDGSSALEHLTPVGTIFSIRRAGEDAGTPAVSGFFV